MKVLVIDDEDLVRKSLARAFASKGLEVHTAAGGIEGINVWCKEQPDIILLDILMPDLSGPKVLEKMNGESTKMGFVILMSAYKGEYDSMSAKALGANEFFEKPFENIFTTVDEVINAYKRSQL